MLSPRASAFLASFLMLPVVRGTESTAITPKPYVLGLMDTLRNMFYFAKESFNASRRPDAKEYYNNVSKINRVYRQLFLTEEGYWRPHIDNDSLKEGRIETIERMEDLIDLASRTTDRQPMPFGGRECGLLPEELRKYTATNYTIAPRLSGPLNAFGTELRKVLERVKADGNTSKSANLRGLMPICEAFKLDYFLKPAISLVGRDCRSKSAENGSVESAMQQDLKDFAKEHKYPRNKDGCLPVVVARYVTSAEAMTLMRQSLDKYLLATIMLQAFCVHLAPGYDGNAVIQKTVQAVDTLSNGMLLGDVSLDYSKRWSCDDYQTTTAKVTERSTYTTSHTSGAAITSEGTSAAPAIGTDPSDIATPTVVGLTTSYEEHGMWKKKANEVAERVISEASKIINANTWEKRCKELHPAVTTALDSSLKNITAKYTEFSHENTTFFSVALLTYNDEGKSCTSSNVNSVHGTHEHVTYLAQPNFQDKLAPRKTDLLENYEQEILDKTFSSASNNLCETAARVLKDVLNLSVNETASAYVVVRCGYKFVWYELGYAYFPAANSTSPYAMTTVQNNVYSANCGQIILFP